MINLIIRQILLSPVQSARFQPWLERIHLFALARMNYGLGWTPQLSGEQPFVRSIVAPLFAQSSSKVAFDVGACAGQYTKLLAKHLPPGSHIFSFEPQISAYRQLDDLVTRDDLRCVTPFNFGFSNQARTARLYKHRDGTALASLYARKLDRFNILMDLHEEIKLETIDDFCLSRNIDLIDLLKLDVEGHEMEVLRGAQRMLSEGRIRIIQWEMGGCDIDSRAFLRDFYYLLHDDYIILRLLANGLHPIVTYKEEYEVFLTTNWCAISRKLLGSEPFRQALTRFAPLLRKLLRKR